MYSGSTHKTTHSPRTAQSTRVHCTNIGYHRVNEHTSRQHHMRKGTSIGNRSRTASENIAITQKRRPEQLFRPAAPFGWHAIANTTRDSSAGKPQFENPAREQFLILYKEFARPLILVTAHGIMTPFLAVFFVLNLAASVGALQPSLRMP